MWLPKRGMQGVGSAEAGSQDVRVRTTADCVVREGEVERGREVFYPDWT